MEIHGRSTFDVESDGTLAFEVRDVRVHQQAGWLGANGTADTYRFAGSGTLRGEGQMQTNGLALKLKWEAGKGTGEKTGQPISEPLLAQAWSSAWTLKPTRKRIKFGTGDWTEVAAYSGTRLMTVPNPFQESKPLQLLEAVELYQLPTADLQVTLEEQAVDGGAGSVLKATVKNLGPDASPSAELSVILPPTVKAVRPPQPVESIGGYSLLTIPIGNLDKGSTAISEIVIERTQKNNASDEEPEIPPVVRVSIRGHDPNPGNNGSFVNTDRGE